METQNIKKENAPSGKANWDKITFSLLFQYRDIKRDSFLDQIDLIFTRVIQHTVENVTNSTWSCKVVWFLAGQ